MKILTLSRPQAVTILGLGLLLPLLTGCQRLAETMPAIDPAIAPDVTTDFADRIDPGAQGIACFHRALAADGDWENQPPYGDVWVPRVARSWRPYTAGHWLNTDEGWAWAADEPWGWAVFHYGRWLYDSQSRWVWVPGTRWAPAWVAWRSGGGYLGWAPLPPAVGFVDGEGLTAGAAEISATHFWFVPEASFVAADLAAHLVAAGLGAAIFSRTVDITRYTVVHDRIVNVGISAQHIAEVTGRPVPLRSVASLSAGAGSTRGVFYQPAAVVRGSQAVHAEFGRALHAQVAAERRVAAGSSRLAPGQAHAAGTYRTSSAARAIGSSRASSFAAAGGGRSVAQRGSRFQGAAGSSRQAFNSSFGQPGTHATGKGSPRAGRSLADSSPAGRNTQLSAATPRTGQTPAAYPRGFQGTAAGPRGAQTSAPYQRGGQPYGASRPGLQTQSPSARGSQTPYQFQRGGQPSAQMSQGPQAGFRPQMQGRPSAAPQGRSRRPPA